MINCNELPTETEQTEAYFRRFLIIPFSQTIPEGERDITLAERIIANELPGVFNWLLCGLERLVKQRKFTRSIESDRVLAEFRIQSDSVQLFIDECRYVKPDSKGEPFFLADLYHRYKEFCKDNTYKALGKNKFSERLEKKGFEKHRHKSGHLFRMAVKSE
jgi:putative DNA primase/helicase